MNLVCDCTVKSQEYSMYADHREQGSGAARFVLPVGRNRAERGREVV